MTNPMPLLDLPTQPRIWLWQVDSAGAMATAVSGWREARLVARTVRGRKMRSVSQLEDEFAAALQFPSYFGENWPALDECLKDLSWLPPEAGYAVVVTEPHLVLDESQTDFEVLVRLLGSAVTEWSLPVDLGDWWDRAGVPFNVVLAVESPNHDATTTRWEQAGADLTRLY